MDASTQLTYEAINQRLITFHARANRCLVDAGHRELAMHYCGHFVSGDIGKAKYLLLSINPGIPAEDLKCQPLYEVHPEDNSVIRYWDEYQHNVRLASEIVNTVFDGDADKLAECAEVCVLSPLATPNVAHWNKAWALLSQDLRDEFCALRSDYLNYVFDHSPADTLIAIGTGTFDSAYGHLRRVREEFSGAPQANWVRNERNARLFASVSLSETHKLLGCVHLSGARVSSGDREIIKDSFKNSLSAA